MNGPLNILLVDDNADIREIVELSLGLDSEIVVTGCDSGFSALKSVAAGLRVDLLLLDMNLVDSTGLDLLASLREHPSIEKVPVIFITASANPAAVAEYFNAGAIGVIAKPFDPVGFVGQIRALLPA